MNFKSVNELEKIDFQDAVVKKFEVKDKQISLELEAAKIESSNSQNEQRVKSYAGPLLLRLIDAEIYSVFKEGYRYYDANNVLVEERPDEEQEKEKYAEIIRKCTDNYIFAFECVTDCTLNDGREKQTEEPYKYMLCVDVDEDTYWFRISFDKAIAEWDKYMNRVQS